jgi:hypothetical protein
MADLTEVTLKAGFSWANTKGETLKVTKDVTYTYAADGTATRKVEEIKKIGWNDFGVTADTTYQDGMTALSYDGTTLNNTEFEGDITFSAQSELRYGGAGEWLGLQLSVDNSGMVDRSTVELNAVLCAVLRVIEYLCRIKERFRRNATLVKTNSAESSALDKKRFKTAVSGSFSGIVARRAAA